MLRKRLLSYGLSLVVMGTVGAACATKAVRDDFTDGNNADSGAGTGITDGDGGLGIEGRTDLKELKGTTFAPNGELELAGVLVYWQLSEPAPIPEGVYCDTCVELPEGTSTISGADGKFTLKVPVGQEVYLVTQKGQFRRVRKITLDDDATEIDEKDTTLPGKMRRDVGDTIPTIAIMTKQDSDTFDVIHEALDKLGVDEYEFLNNSDSADDHDVTEDIDQLSKYQIVMFPCGSGAPTTKDQETLREYAKRGGKIYTSDHALKYVDMTFNGVVTGISTGTDGLQSCGSGSCGAGRFVDDNLSSWMEATGDSSVELEGIWSKFGALNPMRYPGLDGTTETDVMPKLWSEVENSSGDWKPASFSFNYGCGRGMFSIFHAHATGSSLAPQEKALLFMLLEVSSCVRQGGDVN